MKYHTYLKQLEETPAHPLWEWPSLLPFLISSCPTLLQLRVTQKKARPSRIPAANDLLFLVVVMYCVAVSPTLTPWQQIRVYIDWFHSLPRCVWSWQNYLSPFCPPKLGYVRKKEQQGRSPGMMVDACVLVKRKTMTEKRKHLMRRVVFVATILVEKR